jgi:DNA-binding CsgD family transcriptional regulator
MTPFRDLLRRIEVARSSQEIGAIVTRAVPGALDLTHPGLTFFDEDFRPREAHLEVSSRFADDYEAFGRSADPVVRAVVMNHAPRAVRADDLAARERTSAYGEFIRRHCPIHGRSYLVAPVIVGGRVAGLMQFIGMHEPARSKPALTALALHVSSRIATLTALERGPAAHPDLTRREAEVADIAARGFTNEETARALGISPNTVKKYLRAIYAKLQISTRAELGTLMARGRR